MESQILKSSLTLFFFIVLTTFTTSAAASSSSTVRPVQPHIRKACKPTPYPRLCETALSLYASQTKRNQQELCRAAMVSSLKAAQNATSIISKISRRKLSPYEAEVIGDCIDNLNDSVDEIRRATTAIKKLSRSKDVDFQLSSIKTWMSAAETDVITCTDGLSGAAGRKVRTKVKKEVKNCSVIVVRQISNALSLINNFNYKH
ncbi:21 kDa protein-like [Benincasa hispida]|uniref:21 kDa protein-like n=1 Tax=Benincasa hispida TaxID=102211 RepID=UPI001901A713|nr:21 kDa protein-like [Benincasa hispida]